jgi:hypothetical protein
VDLSLDLAHFANVTVLELERVRTPTHFILSSIHPSATHAIASRHPTRLLPTAFPHQQMNTYAPYHEYRMLTLRVCVCVCVWGGIYGRSMSSRWAGWRSCSDNCSGWCAATQFTASPTCLWVRVPATPNSPTRAHSNGSVHRPV